MRQSLKLKAVLLCILLSLLVASIAPPLKAHEDCGQSCKSYCEPGLFRCWQGCGAESPFDCDWCWQAHEDCMWECCFIQGL